MFTVDKDFIIEAHKEACLNWKRRLEDKFPDVFKSVIEPGRWYTSDTGGLWFIQEIRDGQQISYGFNRIGNWDKSSTRLSTGLEPTTESFVEKKLIAEALKRGYAKGNFTCLIDEADEGFNGWHYSEFDNILYTSKRHMGGMAVFRNGEWAEIKDKPVELSMEEIADKFGITVEQLKIKK
jgi:hypothetical protein